MRCVGGLTWSIVGVYFASTPGLLIAMAVGRPFTPGAQVQDLADLLATPARDAELVISMEATRLETGFGEMGWHWDHGVK